MKGKVMFECMLCGDLFRSALRCGRKKKKIQEVCLDDLEEKFFRGTYRTL